MRCAQGVADGTIDAIATDHAPHAVEEKEAEFDHVAARDDRPRDGAGRGAHAPRASRESSPSAARSRR